MSRRTWSCWSRKVCAGITHFCHTILYAKSELATTNLTCNCPRSSICIQYCPILELTGDVISLTIFRLVLYHIYVGGYVFGLCTCEHPVNYLPLTCFCLCACCTSPGWIFIPMVSTSKTVKYFEVYILLTSDFN